MKSILLFVLTMLLFGSAAIGQDSMPIPTDESKEGSYLILKISAAVKKRQEVIAKYQKQLEQDPEWKSSTEELTARQKKLEDLTQQLLSKHKCEQGECEVVWSEDVIKRKPKEQAKR